jgi:DNA invertase Pin-like site-specific DNA recombinase
VVPKLDRLARSVPDARQIGDSLAGRNIRLQLGAMIYDPADPMGKMFFNILATFAEFEVDLLRMRTREGMAAHRLPGPRRFPERHDRVMALVTIRMARAAGAAIVLPLVRFRRLAPGSAGS